MIGTSVGPYRILQRLGAGGMGEVYLADDSRLRRRVALKRLTDSTLGDAEVRARILREARAAAKLHHPGIATIFDVVEDGDVVWIVMEFVEGETLSARLDRGRVPQGEALEIGTQIAEALAAAHAGGVLHCDLKPSNVHLTPAGKAKILDFGLAQRRAEEVASDETRMASMDVSAIDSGRVTGTPGYMAPERLSGGRPDERSDIYSLGVALFELLTGRRPFLGSDLVAVAATALSTPAPTASSLDPEIPDAISEVVARALAATPAERFERAADLATALRAAREGRSHAVKQPSGRGRAIMVAAGVVVLLGAGMMLGGWWPGGGGESTGAGGLPAIVVKPFANLSGDPANDYLGVGMSDNLIVKLAALPHVTVMSRATTAAYVADHPNSTTLARDLGASYVVDGSVARAGDRLNVSLTLLLPDGSVVWGQEYDGPLSDLFTIQRDVAQGIAGGLNLALSEDDRDSLAARPTDNVEAFADYSQGQTFLDRSDVGGNLDRAIDLFERAIAKDPGFALAHAGLGAAYWQQFNQTSDAAWTARATSSSLEALRLDPKQADVHVTLATIHNGLGRTPAAVDALNEALALQPSNDDAHRLLGDVLAADGRTDDAVAAYQRAIAIRPNYWQNHNRLAVALMRAGRFEEAAGACLRVTELQPDSAVGFNNLGVVAMMEGDLAVAQQSFERGIEIAPRFSSLSNVGTIYYWNGQFDAARQAYESAMELRPDDRGLYRNLGDALSQLGQAAAAEAAYLRALELAANQLRVNPRDAESLSLTGLLEAKLGRFSDARAHVDEAVALAPTNYDVHHRSAVIAALAGDREMALAALKAAATLGYPKVYVRNDLDLEPLFDLPEFQALIGSRQP